MTEATTEEHYYLPHPRWAWGGSLLQHYCWYYVIGLDVSWFDFTCLYTPLERDRKAKVPFQARNTLLLRLHVEQKGLSP